MNWYTILKLEGLLNDVIEMEIENYGEMIEETYKKDGELEEAIFKKGKERFLISIYNIDGFRSDLTVSKLIRRL